MSKAKMNGAEKNEQWLVRLAGGPLRVVRSNRPLSESRVKEIYLSQLNFRSSRAVDDPDVPWPALKQITDDELSNGYNWLTEESRRKNFRGVIQVVDGIVIADNKELPERNPVITKTDSKSEIKLSK